MRFVAKFSPRIFTFSGNPSPAHIAVYGNLKAKHILWFIVELQQPYEAGG